MQLNFFCAKDFHCSDSLRPHLKSVFLGEYDIPLEGHKPPVILDMGANVGAYAIWASHRWPGSEIHCYEPHPDNFKLLEKNLKDYPNVKLNPVGVGEPGLRALYDGFRNEGECSFHRMLNNPLSHGQHIKVISPLQLPKADILKMDIEGCETEVLSWLSRHEKLNHSAICLEYHSEDNRRECDGYLKDYKLIAHHMYNQHRGVVRYIRKDLI